MDIDLKNLIERMLEKLFFKIALRLLNAKTQATMNKCLLPLSILLLSALTVNAQFQKGSSLYGAYIGGLIDFKNKDDAKGSKTPYEFNLGFSYGRFVTPKNEVGLELGIGFSQQVYLFYSQLDPSGSPVYVYNDFIRNSYVARLYVRHYSNLTEKLFFSSGVSGAYSFQESERGYQGSLIKDKTSIISVGYTPSLVYFLSNKLGIQGRFGFGGLSFSQDNGSAWDAALSFNFSSSNLNFGIFYLFNGSKSND